MLKHLFVFGLTWLFYYVLCQRSIDVLHYKFEIGLSDNNDTIYGKALIHIQIYPASLIRQL